MQQQEISDHDKHGDAMEIEDSGTCQGSTSDGPAAGGSTVEAEARTGASHRQVEQERDSGARTSTMVLWLQQPGKREGPHFSKAEDVITMAQGAGQISGVTDLRYADGVEIGLDVRLGTLAGKTGVWVTPTGLGASYLHVEGHTAYFKGTTDTRFIFPGDHIQVEIWQRPELKKGKQKKPPAKKQKTAPAKNLVAKVRYKLVIEREHIVSPAAAATSSTSVQSGLVRWFRAPKATARAPGASVLDASGMDDEGKSGTSSPTSDTTTKKPRAWSSPLPTLGSLAKSFKKLASPSSEEQIDELSRGVHQMDTPSSADKREKQKELEEEEDGGMMLGWELGNDMEVEAYVNGAAAAPGSSADHQQARPQPMVDCRPGHTATGPTSTACAVAAADVGTSVAPSSFQAVAGDALCRNILKVLLELKLSMLAQKRHAQGHSESVALLVQRASSQDLRVEDVDADGDCQFHALARASGYPGGRRALRTAVTSWLRREGRTYRADPNDRESLLQNYPETEEEANMSWDEYCDHVNTSGYWGGQRTLIAAANVLQRPILVITTAPTDHPGGTTAMIYPRDNGANQHFIPVGHLDQVHYMALLPAQQVDMDAEEDEEGDDSIKGEEEEEEEEDASVKGESSQGGAPRSERDGSRLRDLNTVVAELVEQQQQGGGFEAMTTVRSLCLFCGILDEEYLTASEAYDSKVNFLVARVRLLLSSFGIDLPEEEETSHDPSARPRLTPNQIRARVQIVRQRYLASNLVSVFELGALFVARAIVVEGFPVSGVRCRYISPLLNAHDSFLADSMVLSVMFHLLLPCESTLRIDISTMRGHFRAWDKAKPGLKGLRLGEDTICRETASHVGAGGFQDIVTDGNPARDAVRMTECGGARHDHNQHPSLMLPKALGHLPTILGIAEGYERTAATLGSRTIPHSGMGPLQQYLSAIATGLGKEGGSRVEFDSVKATKSARSTEKKRGTRTPWAALPRLVKAEVILRTGKTSDKEFDELNWKPQNSNTSKPWSPLCYYRSVHGIEGGAQDWDDQTREAAGAAPGTSKWGHAGKTGGNKMTERSRAIEAETAKDPKPRKFWYTYTDGTREELDTSAGTQGTGGAAYYVHEGNRTLTNTVCDVATVTCKDGLSVTGRLKPAQAQSRSLVVLPPGGNGVKQTVSQASREAFWRDYPGGWESRGTYCLREWPVPDEEAED